MTDTLLRPALPQTELALRLHQQELVAAFGLFALRQDRLDVSMQEACVVATRGLGTNLAKVLRFRPETQDLLICAGVGWVAGVVGVVTLGIDLASPAGYALRTKLPVVSNHLSEDTRFRTPAILAEHGVHRAINVILEGTDGNHLGVLEADSTDRLDFTVHDIAFMQSLANVLSAAIDRQARQEAQEGLLREKDMLMQEVHHRVKNSLQLVQTMLNLQARGLPEGEERVHLQEAAGRIMTIAAVHRRLHQEGAIEDTDAASYFQGLIDDIGASLKQDATSRQIAVSVEPMTLSADSITPLGLITTELVTNALKYGSGQVSVQITRTPDGVEITVEDDGPGFPPEFEPARSRSLGMRLITALARTPNAIVIDREASGGRVSVRVALA
ncbi:MAG: histidine kinase dimerization/phosphoacceptor domain -containing protein [Acetobacteraceae bacterium]